MRRNTEDIRTPRNNVKIGEKVMRGMEPVALIKQGEKKDIRQLAEELSVAIASQVNRKAQAF